MAASVAPKNFSALEFYSRYAGLYKRLWEVLGRAWTSLPAEVVWARENIPGKSHGVLNIELTDQQRAALLQILAEMEFFDALELAPGDYDELDVTGAKFQAMVRRVSDLRQKFLSGTYRFKRIVCMAGQRPREGYQQSAGGTQVRIDGTLDEIKAELTGDVLRNDWVQGELRNYFPADPEDQLWRGPFATEFELMILAWLIAYDGDVVVSYYQPTDDSSSLPGIPRRTTESCTLTLPDGTQVLVLNCPAVERPHGDPRPTTTSTSDYRLKNHPPVWEAVTVGVSGPTHYRRVLHDLETQVHAVRPDVTVLGMARSADDPEKVLNNALAEAVWLLVKAYQELLSHMTG